MANSHFEADMHKCFKYKAVVSMNDIVRVDMMDYNRKMLNIQEISQCFLVCSR